MKKFLLTAALLSGLLSACAIGREAGEEREARDICLDRARESGHRVRRVKEEHKENREIYRVTLDIEDDSQDLFCDYHEDSRVAELHW